MLFVECLQKRGTERLALGKGVQRLYRVLLVEWSHRIAMKFPHGNPKPKLKFPTCIGYQYAMNCVHCVSLRRIIKLFSVSPYITEKYNRVSRCTKAQQK